jgi:hypothetical protein
MEEAKMGNSRRKLLRLFSYFCLSLVTVAGFMTIVGSGGGDDKPEIGYFVDGPVEGLRYTTANLSGETNEDGTVDYRENYGYHKVGGWMYYYRD